MTRTFTAVLCICVAASAVAAGAVVARTTSANVKRAGVALPMPRPHRSYVTRHTLKLRHHPPGVFIFMQLHRRDGTWSPEVPIGRKVVLAAANGRRQGEVTLQSARYDRRKGIVRFAVRVRNIGVPKRRYRRVRVTLAVSVTWR
jgi:hypothetical protein